MHVEVNGAKLYFDVEGPALAADGPQMQKRPTLILLHGGPGADHSIYKPAFSELTDVAQVIYLDHRGNGRSTGNDPETWTLAQWGDDVKGFCDALGIERPVVLGTSFGGFVAQSYATRHPGHPGALILVSTAARIDFDIMYAAFERIGGSEIRKLAEDYWSNPTDESRKAYRETCVPYYTVQNINWPELIGRAVVRDDVSQHFAGPGNEMYRFDFRNDLARISCPTLVMAGVEDPITPPAFSEEIDGHIPRKHVRLERFSQAGHGVVPDRPEEAFSAIRRFIARHLEHLI